MENCIEELIKAVNALKTVEVKGDHWLTMYASCNSIKMVISLLQGMRGEENAINDNTKP